MFVPCVGRFASSRRALLFLARAKASTHSGEGFLPVRTGSKRGSIAAQVNISHELAPVKISPTCLGTLSAVARCATVIALVARGIALAKRPPATCHKCSGEISGKSVYDDLAGDAA